MALETSTGELLRVSGLTASVDEKEILHGIDLSSWALTAPANPPSVMS